jgi:hypothetical protein
MNDLRVAFQSLLYRLFGEPECRRRLLKYWHSYQTTKHARLADAFGEFIACILLKPVAFHMLHDRLHLFGDAYSVRYEWLAPVDQDVVLEMFRARASVFAVARTFPNGQFDLSHCAFREQDIVCWTWRRQLVRDFVWLAHTRLAHEPHVRLEMLASVQRLLLLPRKQLLMHAPFLWQVHAALQGRTFIDELLCWDAGPGDAHPLLLAALRNEAH